MDLTSTVVALVTSYLSARGGRVPGGSTSAGALYELLRSRLGDLDSLRTMDSEATSGRPSELAQRHLAVDLQEAFASDPSLAAQAGRLTRQAQTEQTTAGGQSSTTTEQHLQQKDLRAGRDIHTNVSSRSRNTKIAIGGGGAVLAATLLFVWTQYSAHETKTEATSAYQSAVLSTCDRIRDTGTFQLSPVLEKSGIKVRRSQLEQQLKANLEVVRDQTGSLLDQQAPAELSNQRAAARTAAQRFVAHQPATIAAVHHLPKKISLDALQSWSTKPDVTDNYRKLGDALTRLAGTTCTIEVRAQTSS